MDEQRSQSPRDLFLKHPRNGAPLAFLIVDHAFREFFEFTMAAKAFHLSFFRAVLEVGHIQCAGYCEDQTDSNH